MQAQYDVEHTRPRGKKSPSNIFSARWNCFQLQFHLLFTVLLQNISTSLSCIRTGRSKKHRTSIKGKILPFDFRPAHKKRLSHSVISVYRSTEDRFEEAKTSTLQDFEMEARQEALAVNENTKRPNWDAAKVTNKDRSTMSPDQEHMSLDHTRTTTTNGTETSGIVGTTSASSSNLNMLADNSATAYSSSSMYRLGSFSSPDLGSTQIDIQQPRDGLPRRGLFSRATSKFSRRNRNGIDRGHIGSPMPLINEDAVEAPTNVRLVRNLELEAQARLLGFELPHNRFGLPEEISSDTVLLGENRENVPADAEMVAGLEISDNASFYTDNASTLYEEEGSKIFDKLVKGSPPNITNVVVSESEGGLNCQQIASPYSASWLTDCFTTSAIDNFLDDFGAPPHISKFPPRSSSLPKMEQKAGLEGPKEFTKSDKGSDRGAENHNKSDLMPNSKDSFGGSGGERSSHKKSTSKEGGFFKSLLGTTEPSQLALKKLKERSLAEANADEKDPDLAARLKTSSRQLPPDAPKPASKEPVPRPKTYQRHSRSTRTLTGQLDPELTLSLNSPSRAPPARPESSSGPERVSLNKSLPESKPEEAEKDEGKKDEKKRGLRNLFSRK